MTPAERRTALEVEYERLKGRADQLHLVLSGDPDAWLSIIERMPDTVAEVTVDKALAEARQNALAMATIVKTLDGTAAAAESAPAAGPDLGDQLKEAREKRQEEARARLESTS